jgi:hypothetical protein
MAGTRTSVRIPGWMWGAVAAILVAIPLVLAVGVPTMTPPAKAPGGAPAPGAPPSSAPSESAGSADRTEGDLGGPRDPGLGVAPPRSDNDAAYGAIEAEMAILRGEKSAIEAEETRLRGVRDELNEFDEGHQDGVPPELFARYEDVRARYNSDVRAYKSRAAAYQMRLADLERRVEALREAAPGSTPLQLLPATP